MSSMRLRAQSQFRTLDTPGGVNLNSNDYLGLASDPRMKRAVLDAVAHATTVGSTGSRLLSGNAREWEEAERSFAQFAGTEAALYFGSGYAANVGLLTSILKPDDTVFSDARNHASLIDGIRLSGAAKVIYPHCDLSFLESVLREHAGDAGAKVIVTETVFSMEGDIAPMDGLMRLAQKIWSRTCARRSARNRRLGPKGRGVAAEHDCEREILASVHTCGKALASAGAFVCGGHALKDYLVNRARTFIFSTAMPPYFARQIQAAVDLAREADAERAHLRQIASALREELVRARVRLRDERDAHRAGDAGNQRNGAARRERTATERICGAGDSAADRTRRQSPCPLFADEPNYARRNSPSRAGDGRGVQNAASSPGRARRSCLSVSSSPERIPEWARRSSPRLLCAALEAIYWKPIQTGTREGTDRKTVMQLARLPRARTFPETYRFAPPVSPHLAARRAGVRIELRQIRVPRLAAREKLIVEGAGGALVPINGTQLMTDLMKHLRLPVLLVARTSLGTINHTLLSLAALRAARLNIRGVIMVGEPES